MTFPQIHADAIRVTLLDVHGHPLVGAHNVYVTDTLTKLTAKSAYTDGAYIREVNASGGVCINFKEDDTFDGVDVDLELCSPDPYLSAWLSGGTLLTGVDPDVPGFAYPRLGAIRGNGVSVELWAKRIDNDDLAADYPYAWWVLPKVRRMKLGDKNFEKALQNTMFSGRAIENPGWGDGPTNDWPEASDSVLQWVPATDLPVLTLTPGTVAAS